MFPVMAACLWEGRPLFLPSQEGMGAEREASVSS